jgi:hypothetical protein
VFGVGHDEWEFGLGNNGVRKIGGHNGGDRCSVLDRSLSASANLPKRSTFGRIPPYELLRMQGHPLEVVGSKHILVLQ